jgi:hypothetical protein
MNPSHAPMRQLAGLVFAFVMTAATLGAVDRLASRPAGGTALVVQDACGGAARG